MCIERSLKILITANVAYLYGLVALEKKRGSVTNW